jgi:NADH-quinone oxidoreductase subunit J
MLTEVLFYIFAGLAIACAVSMVYHKNPLYSAIALVGVFISLSCLYLSLAAPFIAVVQILVYAGAIMVLVVFVIMLLNLEDDKYRPSLRYLIGIGGGLALVLMTQALFVFYAVLKSPAGNNASENPVGSTLDIGKSMYTEYILPVEIVGVMLLMAVIGGVMLARKFDAGEDERILKDELEKRHLDQ